MTLQEQCLVETMAQVFKAEVREPRPVKLASGATIVTAHSLETLMRAGIDVALTDEVVEELAELKAAKR